MVPTFKCRYGRRIATYLIIFNNIGRHERSCLVFARERQSEVEKDLVIDL